MFKENQEQLFIDELSKGINLFVGAGFSVLPDSEGNTFPDANELCKEICDKFSVSEIFNDDLYAASELIPKIEYQDFLRERFKLKGKINPKYKLIDKLNLKSIITTNIDNIIKTIFNDEESQHYLIDKGIYGTVRKDELCIEYIALNGDVCVEESYLYFGKFDLSTVESQKNDWFKVATMRFFDAPILFWGYSFYDIGVQKMVKKLLDSNKQANIWVQCLQEDEKQIAFFSALGCKVIISDTEQLFDWIQNKYLPALSDDSNNTNNIYDKRINKYRVPKQYSIETNEKEDYYKFGITQWYSIYNNHAYETNLVDDIWSLSLQYKNVVVIGSSFSGKTTALMQCAVKRNNNTTFYFHGDSTKEEAEKFLKLIGGRNIIVYLQDFHNDVETFCCFALANNVRLISTADTYLFESVKHIIAKKSIVYGEKSVGNIDKNTARQIYNHIPKSIVQPVFTYKENANEGYSFLELLGHNVKGFASYESVLEMLRNVCEFYEDGTACDEIQLIALTVYLQSHESFMSTDLFFSYFDYHDYFTQIAPLSKKVKDLLNDTVGVSADQDYFSIRSRYFLNYAQQAFTTDPELKLVYGDMISRFVEYVPKMNVFRYDNFRRKAYDSKLFFKLFCDNKSENKIVDNKAIKLYDMIYNYDNSPYTLQQKALCLSLLRRSKEAFAVIDEALSFLPNNFSMKNSKAEIIFNANKSFYTDQAEIQLKKAIDILEECRENDKKQNYHAILYAQIVLHLNNFFNNSENMKFVQPSIEWLETIKNKSDKTISKLLEKLHNLIN